MRVLIIGCGNMGRGIATRLAAGKHELTLYDIDSAASENLANDLGGTTPNGAKVAVAETPGDGVPGSDVVILASWYGANLETARTLGAGLAAKIVVDISNPLNKTSDGLVTPPGTLLTGQVAGQTLDVFIAGDDQKAKDTVATLVRDGGLNAIDVGGLERARQLEPLGLLGITLQARLGTKFGTAWKLLMPAER